MFLQGLGIAAVDLRYFYDTVSALVKSYRDKNDRVKHVDNRMRKLKGV